jgi:hypothetical protein
MPRKDRQHSSLRYQWAFDRSRSDSRTPLAHALSLGIDVGRQGASLAPDRAFDRYRRQTRSNLGSLFRVILGLHRALYDNRRAEDGSRVTLGHISNPAGDKGDTPRAHPPAPGMKHLIETDGFIPSSHDR